MAKFRKKPVVIDAEQWFPGKCVEGVIELDGAGIDAPRPFVKTLEGPLFVSPGDWIIMGVKGERYPCKPDIFAGTYEPADAPAADPAADPMLQFFGYAHLPPAMQAVSKPFCDLAHTVVATLPRNPERTVALRKLLEAKDCAVRATIFKS